MPTVKVRVKADQRGEYGVAGSEPGENHLTGVAGWTNIIRNAGEVFVMDVRAMKKPGQPGTGGCEEVTVKIGQGKTAVFVLPTWVESVKGTKASISDDDLVAHGHKTTHSATGEAGSPTGDVI